MELHQKVPLTAYGRASGMAIFFTLIRRSWALMSPFKLESLKRFFLRLLLMPSFFFLLWIFYYNTFKDGMDVRGFRHVHVNALVQCICDPISGGQSDADNLCHQKWPHLQLFGWSLHNGNHHHRKHLYVKPWSTVRLICQNYPILYSCYRKNKILSRSKRRNLQWTSFSSGQLSSELAHHFVHNLCLIHDSIQVRGWVI